MATNQSSGTKQSRSQHTTTTHFPVHQIDTHHFYFTLVGNAAIHYGTNSIQETPSIRQGNITISVHGIVQPLESTHS